MISRPELQSAEEKVDLYLDLRDFSENIQFGTRTIDCDLEFRDYFSPLMTTSLIDQHRCVHTRI